MKEKDKVKKCPACKTFYAGYPALSRRDNKTSICASCGRSEAWEDFHEYRKNRLA